PSPPVAFAPWQNAQFAANSLAPRSAAAASGAGPRPRKMAVLSARAGFSFVGGCAAVAPLLLEALLPAVCAPSGNTLAARSNAAGIENRRTWLIIPSQCLPLGLARCSRSGGFNWLDV